MMDEKLDETPETVEAPEQEVETPAEQPETFPRDYVEKLRREAAEARTRAKRADDLERALFTERVRATGRLADPEDLPFAPGLVDDAAKLSEAVDTLLASKPHLAARRIQSTIGQGNVGKAPSNVSLMDMLRGA